MPTIKVEVHRGRKISANYQSQDASISIVGSIDVPVVNPDSETSPTSDEAAATVRDQIQWLWQLAEDELAAKVAELSEQPLEAPTAQPQPEQHQQYQPAQQNGYSTGGDPYGPPKQQRTWGAGGNGNGNGTGYNAVQTQQRPGGYPSQQRSTGGYGGGGAPAGGSRFGDLPKTGRQFFAWAKKQEEQRGEGLIKHITTYVKNQGIDGRMMDWSPDTTALAVAEAIRCLQG